MSAMKDVTLVQIGFCVNSILGSYFCRTKMTWGDRAIEDVVPAEAALMFRIELIGLEY